jgi:MoaD family protein
MKVKVQFFASVRELINLREETLDLDNDSTVEDLLRLLAAKHGEKLGSYLFDSKTGKPRSYLQFLLNQQSISTFNGLSTLLEDGAVFAIIPPVGGG